MPKGPRAEKRLADATANAVKVMRVATATNSRASRSAKAPTLGDMLVG